MKSITIAEGALLLICRYQQIMHYHMQNEEYGKVIEACKRYGDQESCLWEQALGYFARKEEDCKTYISEVLQHIDQNNLMPPLLGEPGEHLEINCTQYYV